MSSIRLALADDAVQVGAIFAEAFATDPVFQWMLAEDQRVEKLHRFFGFLASEALVPLAATHVSEGCAAAWTPPEPAPWPDERGARFMRTIGEVFTQGDLERLAILNEVTDAHHPAEPVWYLSVLAARPDLRGRGLGGAMLEHTLAIVDTAAMPAYLESTNPRNVSLYERHGFTVVDVVALAPGGPVLTTMWRDPRQV